MNGRFNALRCERSASGVEHGPGHGVLRIVVSLVAVVDGQVGLGDLQLEQVGSARELQGGGLRADAPARGQDVGDVLGAEGLQLEPVVERAGDGLLAVQLGQGEDLAQVHAGVDPLGLEPFEVGLGARGQRQEVAPAGAARARFLRCARSWRSWSGSSMSWCRSMLRG